MLVTAKLAISPSNKAASPPNGRELRSCFRGANVPGENTAADQLSPPCFCESDAIETEHSFLGGFMAKPAVQQDVSIDNIPYYE